MKRAIIIGTIMILFAPQLGWGQIPQTMSYQGVVTDASGVAVDGNVDLTFRLWDAATAGTELWTETQAGTPVNNGIFNVILGSFTSLNIPFDKQYWLGVTVGTDPELAPRVQLTSSPYSLSSQSGGGGNSLDAADGDPADALFVDNAGNVGIGTTSPGAKLHVFGNVAVMNGGLGLGTVTPLAALHVKGSVIIENTINGPTTGNGNLFLRTYNSGNLLLLGTQTTGNVGIGTTAPSKRLEVAGTVKATAFVGDGSSLTNLPGGGDPSYGSSAASPNDAVFVNDAGKIGIGTSTPVYKLDVQDNTVTSVAHFANADPNGLAIRASATGSGFGVYAESQTGIGVYGTATLGQGIRGHATSIGGFGVHGLATNGAYAGIFEGGNVGIGTLSPAYKLDVNGDINFTGSLLQNGSPFGGGSSLWSLNGSSAYYNAGNVGIGTTSPLAKFHVNGDIKAEGKIIPKSAGWGEWIANGRDVGIPDWGLAFGAGTVTRMFIKNSGNVGIGTTNPSARLEVAGNTIISGSLTVKGTAQSLGSNGFTKLPGGLYYQWGRATVDNATIVYFHTPFPNAIFQVVATMVRSNPNKYVAVSNLTTTNFWVRSNAAGGSQVSWIAIGY